MIAGTLSRYFFRRYAMTTIWFLLGVMSIIFLVDFSETTSRTASIPGTGLTGALTLTLYHLPLILQQTIPFITLFVGITTLVSLNRRYELVVTRAAGISVWQFMRPFILGSVLLGLVTIAIINPLAAAGSRAADQLETTWQAGKSDGRRSTFIPWMRQISGQQDTIVGARTVREEGTLLVDPVFIHFDSEGRIVLRQDAATAKLKDGYWLLNKVTEARPGQIPKVIDSVQLRTNLKQEFVQERLTKPEAVAFLDLPAKIRAAKSFGVSSSEMETQFHSLLSLPFLLVAMTMIAATVSLKFSRFNQSSSMIFGGIVSGFVLYVVTVLVKAFGSSGVVPPFVAAWIPVVVAMAIGATILLHQEDG
jgi:lipopolysaccharide export system permease protein